MSAGEVCTAHEIDTNFLTGAQIETSIVDGERVRSVRRKVPARRSSHWANGFPMPAGRARVADDLGRARTNAAPAALSFPER